MAEEQEDEWDAVDRYLADRLLPRDDALEETLAANVAADLPAIDVSPLQGRLLEIIVRMLGARRILEIGTLGGYSTICLARGLPADGRVVTLEYEPRHATVARANIAHAGLASRVEIRVGPAIESLPILEAEGAGPFDLVFIDADKQSNDAYLRWALRLSRPGTIIICDNIVRHGAIIDPNSEDAGVQGTRRFFDLVAAEPRLRATAIQTVGTKGWDGFAILIVGGAQ
jgi:predicted O-methyltransferase YrrM